MGRARTKHASGPADEELYELAMRFISQSTAHGLPKVAGSDSCSGRTFWSAIILGALVLFCIQCTSLLQRYFDYPKSVRLEVVNKPVPFPAVSVCNLRPLDIYSFVDTLYTGDGVLRWRVGKDFNYSGRNNSLWPAFEKHLVDFGNNYMSYFTYSEKMKSILNDSNFAWTAEQHLYSRMTLAANFDVNAAIEGGTQRDQFISKCEYAGERCSSKNFTWFLDPAYFSCYTFDMSHLENNNLHTIYEGPDHGLSLVVFLPSVNSFNLSGNALDTLALAQDLSLGGEGMRLVIHEQNTIPYPLTDGLDIPRGVSASVGIKMEQNVRLSQPYGNCTNKKTVEESLNYSYTMASCKKNCLQKLVIESCGCADIALPHPSNKNTRFCASFDTVPDICRESLDGNIQYCRAYMHEWFNRMICMKSVRSNVSQNLSAWRNCQCEPRCEDANYHCFLSFSDWPMAEQSMRILRDIMWTENFLSAFPKEKAQYYFGPLLSEPTRFEEYSKQVEMKNFLRINVYISDTSVVKIEETEAYGFTQLVSDVGGQLGLWIGVSIISLVELLELFLTISSFAIGRFCIPNRVTAKRAFEEVDEDNGMPPVSS